ncbi:MAG: type II toxin-antitoxin system RelE/ParE family toxin [Bacteroidota bacterium]
MGNYKLSNDAEEELIEIYYYSVLEFGINQARRYTTGLHQTFNTLTDNPKMGRVCKPIKEEYRRYEHKSHVIFYVIIDDDILILHVLGESQDPTKHLI